MSEILIMSYPKVEYGNGKKDFKVATVFHGIPLICFQKVPKCYRDHLENEIEDILEHETLHIVLDKVEPQASKMLDKILPWTHSKYILFKTKQLEKRG